MVKIKRNPPAATGFDDRRWRAGARLVDLTPPLDRPLGGYGPVDNGHARGFFGRLHASILVLDDGKGTRGALIAADLHAGTRYVCERLGEELADLGMTVDRIFLAGSHTHAGPARFYGNDYFDDNAGVRPMALGKRGFDLDLAEDLVARIARGTRDAAADLHVALLGYGTDLAEGHVLNRSMEPFSKNQEHRSETLQDIQEALGGGPRPSLPGVHHPEALRATDARVHVIWAERADGSGPIGAFASLGAHPTVAPRHNRLWSGDAYAVAAAWARRKLHGVPLSICGGTVGDTNITLSPGLVDEAGERLRRSARGYGGDPERLFRNRFVRWRQPTLGPTYDIHVRPSYLDLTQLIGEALGAHLVRACKAARHIATTSPLGPGLTCSMTEPKAARARVHLTASDMTDVDREHLKPAQEAWVQLADRPQVGAPATKAAEAGQHLFSWVFPSVATNPYAAYEHRPKRKSRIANQVEPSPVLPVRVWSVGELALVGLPMETTTMLGLRVRRLIERASAGPRCVMVCSPCGDYAGYATTAAEYDVQEYEGASVLWGRHTGTWVLRTLQALLHGTAPGLEAEASFNLRVRGVSHAHAQGAASHAAPKRTQLLERPRALPRGKVLLFGRWGQVGKTSHAVNVGVQPWLRLQVSDAKDGSYETLRIDGVHVSDAHYPFLVERRVYDDQVHWRWCVELPAEALSGRWVRVLLHGPESVSGPNPIASKPQKL